MPDPSHETALAVALTELKFSIDGLSDHVARSNGRTSAMEEKMTALDKDITELRLQHAIHISSLATMAVEKGGTSKTAATSIAVLAGAVIAAINIAVQAV